MGVLGLMEEPATAAPVTNGPETGLRAPDHPAVVTLARRNLP
jgi:hypothetical protein